MPSVPDSTSKNFLDSGIRITTPGANHYHITLCVNKKYERSKTALMKAAFPEMSRVTLVFSFNLIHQKLRIADR